MAITRSELEKGKKFFYFRVIKIGWDEKLLSISFYLVEYEQYNPPYFFKVLKDYSKIFSSGLPSDWSSRQTANSLKNVYKENYKTMKRRFVRALLGPGL